jgi:hypothetical protein
MNAAQGLVVGNILSEGAFGLDLWNFITSDEKKLITSGKYKGQMGTSSRRITLKEMLNGFKTHGAGVSENEFQLAWKNIQDNWMQMAIGTIATPIAFKVAKKVLRKPVITPLNKAVKMAGLNDVKVG